MTERTSIQANRPIRVAIVGAGKMGINHIHALRGCPTAKLAGIVDPLVDRSQLAEHIASDVEIVQNVDELFTRVQPDVVHIVTPPHTHVDLARAVLEAGAHVYVEKPFTSTRHEAEMLTRLAADRGLQVCAGHQCLFDHASVVGRGRLAEIGEVVRVESYFSFRTVRKSITPVDQAMDILPHAVYMLLDFLRTGGAGDPLTIDGLNASADGTVNAIVSIGARRGILSVSLRARPVEQYVHVTGTNGILRIDLVTGAVVVLPGAGANLGGALINPWRHARQTFFGATRGFVRNMRERKYGYPGLRALFQAFYDSIRTGAAPAMTSRAIEETVGICEQVGRVLTREAAAEEDNARAALAAAEARLPAPDVDRGVVLVTGAGGFLGRRTVEELRERGWPVRALTRRPARFVDRVPGVEYRECDLAANVPTEMMSEVSAVVHCAAETAGGQAAQERNSIRATRVLAEAAAGSGVSKFVHISSLAVLKPVPGTVDENTPVDASLERGPYAWGKAESELALIEIGRNLGMGVRVIRPGPLVDFREFDPPGRLGREVGPWFVAIGPRSSKLPLIDVGRAAAAIAAAVEQFDETPHVVNLVDPAAPVRVDLVERLRERRPDLGVFWVPLRALKLANPFLKLAQRLVLGSKRPLDVAAAFDVVAYDTRRAAELLARDHTMSPQESPAAVGVP